MPLLDRAFLLACELSKYLSEMLAQLPIQRTAPTFGYENDVIFALPRRMTQTFKLVHRDSSFRVLGGSRSKVLLMDTPCNVKLLLPPRQSRGVSLFRLGVSLGYFALTTSPEPLPPTVMKMYLK